MQTNTKKEIATNILRGFWKILSVIISGYERYLTYVITTLKEYVTPNQIKTLFLFCLILSGIFGCVNGFFTSVLEARQDVSYCGGRSMDVVVCHGYIFSKIILGTMCGALFCIIQTIISPLYVPIHTFWYGY